MGLIKQSLKNCLTSEERKARAALEAARLEEAARPKEVPVDTTILSYADQLAKEAAQREQAKRASISNYRQARQAEEKTQQTIEKNLEAEKKRLLADLRAAAAPILKHLLQLSKNTNKAHFFVKHMNASTPEDHYRIRVRDPENDYDYRIRFFTSGNVEICKHYYEQVAPSFFEDVIVGTWRGCGVLSVPRKEDRLYRTNICRIGLHFSGIGDVRPDKIDTTDISRFMIEQLVADGSYCYPSPS